ncbi:MAG TPA: DUF2179 domain-containing protein [Bacillota bacterium]|nr:DUF2179 domain-containing protein [Bacillota bacterium]
MQLLKTLQHSQIIKKVGLTSMLTNAEVFSWIVLPLLIFLARICDVTIGTIRIIFVSRGQKIFASLLGFCEVLIWLVAIGQIMKNLNNFACYIAYAGGFALGNYIGIALEAKLAMGVVLVRIITRHDGNELIAYLKEAGYGVTSIDAKGAIGPVHVVYTVIKRTALAEVVEIIHRFNPKAFYSVEDIRTVKEGVFPTKQPSMIGQYLPVYGKRR